MPPLSTRLGVSVVEIALRRSIRVSELLEVLKAAIGRLPITDDYRLTPGYLVLVDGVDYRVFIHFDEDPELGGEVEVVILSVSHGG